jgi:hypothetical protein
LRREDEFHNGGLPVVVLFEPLGEADDIGTCRPGPKGDVALLFMVVNDGGNKATILMLACRCSLAMSKKYTRLS